MVEIIEYVIGAAMFCAAAFIEFKFALAMHDTYEKVGRGQKLACHLTEIIIWVVFVITCACAYLMMYRIIGAVAWLS